MSVAYTSETYIFIVITLKYLAIEFKGNEEATFAI